MSTEPSIREPIPVWLDVDTGHDDAFAILLAARHPGLKLLGVSTTFGNAPLEQTTYNTRAILKAVGREDVPVYAGAAGAFCQETRHAPEIHGASGLDGTTCLPTPTVPISNGENPNPGATITAMYTALISTAPGTAWLIPTGALTNTALLFTLHPALAAHLAGISIMGGAVGGGFTPAPLGRVGGEAWFGNWTPFAEFNIDIDPESAKAVLELNAVLREKATLVTLDLSHLFLATEAVKRGLAYGFDEDGGGKGVEGEGEVSTVRKLFLEILAFFSKTYAEVYGIVEGPPVHDLLAVAAVLMPEAFDDRGGERFDVEVVTDEAREREQGSRGNSQRGRTVCIPAKKNAGNGIRIPRGVEQDRVWRVLEGCLARVEEAGCGSW